ncbi:MAG: ferrochelatase [Luminiphilus sp.]|nr:ferrochelatase [Luminiphilus sp.]
MKYVGQADYQHQSMPRVGVLLTNLGTPEAPTAKALRPYLKQFLWDPRVVEVPRPIWWLILNGIILNTRPKRSAEAYSAVWNERGSPLLAHLEDQVAGVAERLHSRFGDRFIVRGAMRYGAPAIADVLSDMFHEGMQKLVVLPLYPQYGGPTTGSTYDEVSNDLVRRRWLPSLRFISSYHDDPRYIGAVADSIRAHWQAHGRAEQLVLSYHGMPKRYLTEGDPYHCQCHKTSRLIGEALGVTEAEMLTTFQSRFGREEWLQPYTDETLQLLPNEGVTSVQIVCPGFSADCLETIEEIDMENRDTFLIAGGTRYEYIPCLNAQPSHLDALTDLIADELGGWLNAKSDPENSAALARKLGATR